ncbi:uncharacterized protein LOC129779609 [Toxorhynchites rutilus septentrionalis]|uniref:uncharacterized protein LOC129779609 n=1 Tax=Toxorhynchites rutilus septentrionalis TaxID=329112 RepID=UPI002478EC83|nr:uncharacterized protein LOC129779609 [Toxorhynchites rutilus septentrionalis]
MLKFVTINSSTGFLLPSCMFHRGGICTSRNMQLLQIRYSLQTQIMLKNRDDDLTATINTIGDPLQVHSTTPQWSKQELLKQVEDLLQCNKKELERVYRTNKKSLSTIVSKTITDNISLLLSRGVTGKTIINFPKILSADTDDVANKLTVLEKFKDLKDINHVLPLLSVPSDALEKIVEISQSENIEHGNRIYFMNAKTGIDCEIISRYFATNIRIYKVSMAKFKSNLDYCLQQMEPLDVVKHLSILAYAGSSIGERLQMLKNSSLPKVKPWMIRAPGVVLEKSFDEAIEKGIDLKFKDPLSEVWFDNHVLKKVEVLLDCNEEEAKTIHKTCKSSATFLENIELMKEMNVRKETILKIPVVLTLNRKELSEKLAALAQLKGVRDMNDVIPLCMLKPYQVKKIVNGLNNEELENGNNRIYHFADKAAVSPFHVAERFARRTFMFRIPKDCYLQNLDLLLENMNHEDVLGDLWAFKYSPAVVAERIDRAKNVPGKKVMPWMVRCPDVVLEKSLRLTKESGDVLGENQSIVEYLCQRLGFSRDVTNSIILKCPSVRNVRITKVKNVIDYLLNELDYNPYDIALNPRILMHSLQTTRKRMEQLKEIGCRPYSLVIVCKSKRQYELFIKEWLATNERKKKIAASNC